jgi:hypothetical protein
LKRGDALRSIEVRLPCLFGKVTQIRRQHRADYRRGVELAAHRQTESACDLMERMGWDREVKSDASQYRVGERVLIREAREGFRANEMLEITGVAGRTVTLRREGGSERRVCPDEPARSKRWASGVEVGKARQLPVAPGEKLLLQANRSRRFVNGEIMEVDAVDGGRVRLKDGWVLPLDYRTFTHGYAVTSHSAQGRTADVVLVVALACSMVAVHQQQFYVSDSRGRESCLVLTDDVDRLRARVVRSADRLAVVEATRGLKPRASLVQRAADTPANSPDQ